MMRNNRRMTLEEDYELQKMLSDTFHTMEPHNVFTNFIRINTNYGSIVVNVQGVRNRPAIVTYHDLGMNHESIEKFFKTSDMRPLLDNFCVFHINAPGQERGAPTLPHNFVYPTMNELSSQIDCVLRFFGINTFIGFGVGAGANILTRFALANPTKVTALCVINCSPSKPSIYERTCHMFAGHVLRNHGLSEGVINNLILYHFGADVKNRNRALYNKFQNKFMNLLNPINFSMFSNSYMKRLDLGIWRSGPTLDVPVLNITGALSTHVVDTVNFNCRLNPGKSTWLNIPDCANVLEEKPNNTSQAFRLFIQGEGYIAPLSPIKLVTYKRLSELERRRLCCQTSVIHITENPISEIIIC